MQQPNWPSLVALIVAAATMHCPAFGNETDAEERFERLYGFKLQLIKGTDRKQDDAEFAAELLSKVEESYEDPAMQTLLCRAAADLTLGYPPAQSTLLEALQVLNRLDLSSRAENYAKIVSIRKAMFASAPDERFVEEGNRLIESLMALARIEHEAGEWDSAAEHYRTARQTALGIKSDRVDEIVRLMEMAKKREPLENDPDRLKEAIKADRNDKGAIAQLLYTYVVERDQPEEARKYTFLIDDEAVKDRIRVAAKRVDTLTADEALQLIRWYRDLSEQAPTAARAAMRYRVELYRDRYAKIAGSETPVAIEDDAVKLPLKPIPMASGTPTAEQLLDALRPSTANAASDAPSAQWLRQVTTNRKMFVALHITFSDGASSESIVDHSPHRHLVLGVSTLYDSGRYGQARRLTGRDSYLAVEPSSKLAFKLRPLAVGMWVKPDSEKGVLFAHGDARTGYALYLTDGKINLAMRNNTRLDTLQSPDPLPPGWVHVGMLLDEENLNLFVNGKVVAKRRASFLTSRPAEGIEIGTDDKGFVGAYSNTTKRFAGLVYEVVLLTGERLR